MAADNDWVVKVGADTKSAQSKIDALENKIKGLTKASGKLEGAGGGSSKKGLTEAEKRQRVVDKAHTRSFRDAARAKVKLETQALQEIARKNKQHSNALIENNKRVLASEKRMNKRHVAAIIEDRKRAARRDPSGVSKRRPSKLAAYKKNDILFEANQGVASSRRDARVSKINASAVKNPTESLKFLIKESKKAEEQVTKLYAKMANKRTGAGLNRYNSQLKTAISDSKKLSRQIDSVSNSMNRQKKSVNSLNTSMRHMVRSYLSVFALGAGVRGFFTLGRDMEAINATMIAASGSAAQAAKDFNFVVETSRELGTSLQEGARGFAKLGTAARAAGMNGVEIKEIFTQISEGASAYGLNPQRTNLTFLAIEQMLSKGVVSMEEIRRQLGEQIFGAFQIAAKSMGMETSEFGELVSSGMLESLGFVKAFGKELSKTVRESGALGASMEKVRAQQTRAGNELTLGVADSFDESSPLFADGFKNIAIFLKDLKPVLSITGKLLGALFSGTTKIISAITPLFGIIFSAIDNVFVLLTGSRALKDAESDVYGLTFALDVLIKSLDSLLMAIRLPLALLRDLQNAITIKPEDSGAVRVFRTLGGLLTGMITAWAGWNIMKKIKPLMSLFKAIGKITSTLWGKGRNFLGIPAKAAKTVAPAIAGSAGGYGALLAGGSAATSTAAAKTGIASKMFGWLSNVFSKVKVLPFASSIYLAIMAGIDAFSGDYKAAGIQLAGAVATGLASASGAGMLAQGGIALATEALANQYRTSNSNTTNTSNVGDIIINGATDPRAVANEVSNAIGLRHRAATQSVY
ncbi:MAG: tape measure protein [Gammaproteobacteria bacterium]|nr:tape measure protein [Gammaproteobacteria bacterium]